MNRIWNDSWQCEDSWQIFQVVDQLPRKIGVDSVWPLHPTMGAVCEIKPCQRIQSKVANLTVPSTFPCCRWAATSLCAGCSKLCRVQISNFKYVFDNWHRCCWEQVSYLSGTLRLNLLWPYYTIQMSQANRRRNGILSMVIQFASLMLLGIWSLWWTHWLLKNWLTQRVYMYIRDRFYSLYIHTHTYIYTYTSMNK